jgi:predicted hydrolase (HD superfamily)
MGKVLLACNELAEFITVVALITPGKSMAEADVKSVRKKMKNKSSREVLVGSRLREHRHQRRSSQSICTAGR